LVVRLGESARSFIRRYGDDGYAALAHCNYTTAKKLVAFADSGGMDEIAGQQEVLQAIARSDDRVANWVMTHPQLLADPDSVACFV
jgi:hypothetical protein